MTKISQNLKDMKFMANRPKSKIRFASGKNWKNQAVDISQAEKLLSSGKNISVLCGNGLFIIDDDDENHEVSDLVEANLPETFTVKTSKGKHFYFYNSDPDSLDKKAEIFKLKEKKADILSDGCCALTAGSIHPDGTMYSVVNDLPIASVSWASVKDLLITNGYNLKGGKKDMESPELRIVGISDIKITKDHPALRIKSVEINPIDGERSNAFNKNAACFIAAGYERSEVKALHDYVYDNLEDYTAFSRAEADNCLESAMTFYNQKRNVNARENRLNKIESGELDADGQKKPLLIELNRLVDKFIETEGFLWIKDGMILYHYNESKHVWEESNNRGNGHNGDLNNKLQNDYLPERLRSPKNASTMCGLIDSKLKTFDFKSNKDSRMVYFSNANIDLKTGEESKPKPTDYTLIRLSHKLNPDSLRLSKEKNTVNKDEICLETVAKQALGDNSDFFFELLGFALLNNYSRAKMFYFVGGGETGKTSIINQIVKCIGNENCSYLPFASLTDSRSTSIEQLSRSYMNVCSEVDKAKQGELGLIKSLCGNDLITASRKYKSDLIFTNRAKLVSTMNNLPKFGKRDSGLMRRLMIVLFKNQPAKLPKDQQLINKLTDVDYEAALIKACSIITKKKMYSDNWTFTGEEDFQEDRIIRYSEHVDSFFNDTLEDFMPIIDSDDPADLEPEFISTKDIWNAYQKYCDKLELEKGARIRTFRAFSMKVSEKYSKNQKVVKRINKKQYRGYMDLAWIKPEEEPEII